MNHPYAALHTLHLVVRFKSLKRTAEHLHLTESAVSHQIKRLEAQLGYTLFYKVGRQLKVTPEGQKLADELAAPFDHIDQVLAEPAHGASNTITIYCLPSLIEPWLLPRLLAFKESFPQYELIINYHSSAPDYLDENSLLIGSYEKDTGQSDLRTKILSGETLPVCSPIYLERLKQPVSNADLLSADLLHDHSITGWQNWFLDRGLSLAQPSQIIYEDFHLLKMATLAAQGIALCPFALIEEDLNNGQLVALSEHKGNLGRYYAIERNKYAQSKITHLVEYLVEKKPSNLATRRSLLSD